MTIDKLEQAVSELPPGKFQEFSTWFEEYKAQQWDEQIERDAKAGRLDEHIQKARETYRSGQSQPLQPPADS
jgi:hypothetical protein